jgi:hypothetical protein
MKSLAIRIFGFICVEKSRWRPDNEPFGRRHFESSLLVQLHPDDQKILREAGRHQDPGKLQQLS